MSHLYKSEMRDDELGDLFALDFNRDMIINKYFNKTTRFSLFRLFVR